MSDRDADGPAPIVFVGGLHRSGTTLVARLLAEHPDATGLRDTGVPGDEGQHLQDVYPPARLLGGPGRFGRHPDAHLGETSPLIVPRAADRLLAAWAPHWDREAPTKVEKSPPNLLRFRFLQALFPDAVCVVVRRHPAAVALATQGLRWTGRLTPVSSLIDHWIHCHRLYEADRPQLRRVIEVDYEDLIAEPTAQLHRLQRACGLSEQPPSIDVSPDPQRAYAERWRTWGRRSGARRRLAPFEAPIRAFGYDLDDLRAP